VGVVEEGAGTTVREDVGSGGSDGDSTGVDGIPSGDGSGEGVLLGVGEAESVGDAVVSVGPVGVVAMVPADAIPTGTRTATAHAAATTARRGRTSTSPSPRTVTTPVRRTAEGPVTDG